MKWTGGEPGDRNASEGSSYSYLDWEWTDVWLSLPAILCQTIIVVSASSQGFQDNGWGNLPKEHPAVDAETSHPRIRISNMAAPV